MSSLDFTKLLIVPSNVLLLSMAVGVLVLTATRRRLAGSVLTTLGIAGLLLGGFSPLSTFLLLPLDQRFSPFSEVEFRPTGIIVLGGGIEVDLSETHGQFVGNNADERQIYMADLARRYPQARLIFSGGGTLPGASINEAEVVARYAEALSLPRSRLVLESRSRNTNENARFTADLVQPNPKERWILVTSAWHMPRAVGCFREAGFQVVPFPVDYRTGNWHRGFGLSTSAAERLVLLDLAVKEWVGLMAYRIAGYTSEWLPAPEPQQPVTPASD